jgi:hypothetical protein
MLVIAARLHHYAGDAAAVRAVAEEARELSSHHGFPLFLAEADVWLGWADVMQHRDRSGLDRARDALDAWRSSGAEMFVPLHLTLLGEAAWHLGDGETALAALVEARARSDAFGDRDSQVETLRLGAVVLASHRHDLAGAEDLLQQAADLAAQQDARSLAARVAATRAELFAGTDGRPDQEGTHDQ